MPLPLAQVTADHRQLVEAAARAAGIADPVAVDLDDYQYVILQNAVRGPFVPLDGVMIRAWDRSWVRHFPGTRFGLRQYRLGDIRLVRCVAEYDDDLSRSLYHFFVVARADYLPLFRKAVRLQRAAAPAGPPPVLPEAILNTLHRNTIGYLHRDNL